MAMIQLLKLMGLLRLRSACWRLRIDIGETGDGEFTRDCGNRRNRAQVCRPLVYLRSQLARWVDRFVVVLEIRLYHGVWNSWLHIYWNRLRHRH
jgi:hypothetical protein